MANSQERTIHKVIRDHRQAKYRKAKEFWTKFQSELGVTYPHYSAIETGAKFPDIKLAIAIAAGLEIDRKFICHLWARDQMPDERSRSYFEPMPGLEKQGVPATSSIELDEFYIFSDKQIPALEENPRIWDILLFINASTGPALSDERTIAKILKVDLKIVSESVEWLRNEGLVLSEGGKLKTSRAYFHLPNTAAFKRVRDRNFELRAQDIVQKLSVEDLASKEAYRTTFSRRLTREQAKQFSSQIDDLIAFIGNSSDEGGEFYSLIVGMASRAPGYKIEKKAMPAK